MLIDNSREAIFNFKLAKFLVIYEVGEKGINLPEYKGSTIRGAFGHVFKKITCNCFEEEHNDECVYSYIFETKPHKDSEVLRNYESIPRPFLFETIYDPRTYFLPGERITFTFTLFGHGINYLPYFIYSLQEMGIQGLGKNNNLLTLQQVFQLDIHNNLDKLIYDGVKKEIYNISTPLFGKDIINNANKKLYNDQIWAYFITPTRIKSKGNYLTSAPSFEEFLKNIVRRFSSIIYFHQDIKLEINYKKLFEDAAKVQTITQQIEWLDWERYSNRQQEKIKLGGIVGKALYNGNIDQFSEWLSIAEWIHIGKNPVFGLGKVKLFNK